MKEIKLTKHATKQSQIRGVTLDEIRTVLSEGNWETAEYGRFVAKRAFPFDKNWEGTFYRRKEVRVIFKEEDGKIIVITVISRYFEN